jgi:probable HAF family extracellular repeat protein
MDRGQTQEAGATRRVVFAAARKSAYARRPGPRLPALRPLWAGGALALLLLAAARPAGAQGYTVTDLGTLGGTWSDAHAVNAAGQVIGSATLSGNTITHAFLWQNGVMRDLGTLGGSGSYVGGINSAGQVVGASKIAGDADEHAFLYAAGVMHDLGALGGTSSVARGINDAGQIVGYSYTPPAAARDSFLYDNGGMHSLPGTWVSNRNIAFAINASGQIVGTAAQPSGPDHAVRYDPAGIHDLGTLGGSISEAYGINAGGQIVGYSYLPGDTTTHAFLFDYWGMHDLGSLENTPFSAATAINSAGQIVGYSDASATAGFHAFLFNNGVLSDLNNLLAPGSGWELTRAEAINDWGQIVGLGGAPGGGNHAFLLTPPAPPAPSNLTASTVSGSQVFLWWADNSPDETAFAIWRQSGGGAFVRIGVVPPNTTSVTDSGLTAGTAYTYEVRAIGLGGASAWSNQVTLTPAAPPLAPPTSLSAAIAPEAHISLTWTDNSSNETAFAIWRQTGGGTWARIGLVAPNTTSFADAGVSPSTTYTYRVRATNNSTASDWSNTVAVTTPAQPGAPAGLSVQVVSATQINLSWTNSGSSLETGIAIFRQSGTGGWVRIRVVAPGTTTFQDGSVSPNTTYSYQVRTHNSYFASNWSNAVGATTPSGP